MPAKIIHFLEMILIQGVKRIFILLSFKNLSDYSDEFGDLSKQRFA